MFIATPQIKLSCPLYISSMIYNLPLMQKTALSWVQETDMQDYPVWMNTSVIHVIY